MPQDDSRGTTAVTPITIPRPRLRSRRWLTATLVTATVWFGLWTCCAAPQATQGAAESSTTRHRPPANTTVPAQPGGASQPDEDRFNALFAQLVAQLAAAPAAATATATTAAIDTRQRSDSLLETIMARTVDPATTALDQLRDMMAEDSTALGQARRAACVSILARGLHRRLQRHRQGHSRRPLNELVHRMLGCIPEDELTAAELTGLLSDAPYLGIVHETTVLTLAQLATREHYLLPLVVGLLETLWNNLESVGARSAQDLANLALLFRQSGNPVERRAAVRHLLTAADGRYRELVLNETVRNHDRELAQTLTMAAATKLEPTAALATLERLASLAGTQSTVGFLTLGRRVPATLLTAYESRLTDTSAVRFRGELVTGAGFHTGFHAGAIGLQLARRAFARDPDVGVRARALRVLASLADAAESERALITAIEDPGFHDDAAQLAEIVLALEHFVATGREERTARIASRLREQPRLRVADRRRLRLIRARSTLAQPKGRGRPTTVLPDTVLPDEKPDRGSK